MPIVDDKPKHKTKRQLHRRIHWTLAIVWMFLAIPSVLLWKDSVPYLVAVSVYANIYSSISAAESSDDR